MSAPKKPDYARLRKQAEEIMWAVQGRKEAWLALIDRAEWLEEQRSAKPRTPLVTPVGDGKGFKGPDFKKPKK